jgi:mannose-6-phosphate isomerase-like protein (cupin superfamily)
MVEDNFLKSIRDKKVNLTEQQVLERFYDRFRWPKFYPWGQPSVEAIKEDGTKHQDFFLKDNYIDSNKCIEIYLEGYTLILSNIGGFCKDTLEIQWMISDFFKTNVNCNFYFGNGKKSVSFDKHSHEYSVLVKNIYGNSEWVIDKQQINLHNQDCVWFNKGVEHQVLRIDSNKLSMTCNIGIE